jgi:hypothetical protein
LGEHVLFLLVRAARGDIIHWAPLEGAILVPWNLGYRFLSKFVTDFTGLVQFRAPAEMGILWLVSQLMALVSSLVATHVFLSREEVGGEVEKISGSVAWTIVGGLSSGWICCFAFFLLITKKRFRGSFVSWQTGYQYVQSKFLREGDENKSKIFK